MRVDAVTVEGGMGGQGNQLLGDEPLRLGDQLVPTRLQRGFGGIRADQHSCSA